MTALTPPKGAEGDLSKYREFCSFRCGWNSPLPGAVPLALYRHSFPRDRVNPAGLRDLPPLTLEGPVSKKGHIFLEMKDSLVFHDSARLFRSIHGKEIPGPEENSFIEWQGLLLSPSGFPYASFPCVETKEKDSGTVKFNYRTWQLGLYKIRLDEKRHWWENFTWSCLWLVRKSAS